MTPDQYLDQRVADQIAWYDRRSRANQRAFHGLRSIEVVAAASIAALAGHANSDNYLPIVVAALGLAVAVIAAVVSLFRFQENWTEYRITCEALRHEKFLFLTGTDPYNVEQPFPLLVQRIESLISKEHSNWAQYMQGGKKEETQR